MAYGVFNDFFGIRHLEGSHVESGLRPPADAYRIDSQQVVERGGRTRK